MLTPNMLTPDRRNIRLRLTDHMDAIGIEAWMQRPHAALGGRTPFNVVFGGDAETVHQLIDRMDAGESV